MEQQHSTDRHKALCLLISKKIHIVIDYARQAKFKYSVCSTANNIEYVCFDKIYHLMYKIFSLLTDPSAWELSSGLSILVSRVSNRLNRLLSCQFTSGLVPGESFSDFLFIQSFPSKCFLISSVCVCMRNLSWPVRASYLSRLDVWGYTTWNNCNGTFRNCFFVTNKRTTNLCVSFYTSRGPSFVRFDTIKHK